MEEYILNIHLIYLQRFRNNNVVIVCTVSHMYKSQLIYIVNAKFLAISKNNQSSVKDKGQEKSYFCGGL